MSWRWVPIRLTLYMMLVSVVVGVEEARVWNAQEGKRVAERALFGVIYAGQMIQVPPCTPNLGQVPQVEPEKEKEVGPPMAHLVFYSERSRTIFYP